MNYASLSFKDLNNSKRLDAKYHIALAHNRNRVSSLLRRNTRSDLDRLVDRIGASDLAWECISRESRVSKCPSYLPAYFTDEEVGLYIIVATFDDSVTEELQALLETVAEKRKIISFRKKCREIEKIN